jgi:hypothetical protein
MTEGMTDEDRGYKGSRFAEVREAIFANPYQKPLPVYDVTLGGVLRGALGPAYPFLKATERAVDSGADLRWGVDGKGFRRILHPNGVCLTGQWRISEQTDYSGYFAKDSAALVVARYSTCCTETRRGNTRSLAMVGKLFPTTDPNHATPLRTANFITQEDIGGASSDYINDAELRNAPDTTVSRRGGGVPILLVTGMVFARADKQPSIRQLYQIAELGKAPAQATKTPEFMRLVVAAHQPRITGSSLDFREEIMAQIFDEGDTEPKRTLTFHIEVTDEGTTTGTQLRQRRTFQNWRPIGTLTFDNAVISYNGDFVIHFNHPTWRENKNDAATATRINERKVG